MCPCDPIGLHRSVSTLAHVMALCLMAQSHYKNQCWLVINEANRYLAEGNFIKTSLQISLYNEFENHIFEHTATSLRGQWVKPWNCCHKNHYKRPPSDGIILFQSLSRVSSTRWGYLSHPGYWSYWLSVEGSVQQETKNDRGSMCTRIGKIWRQFHKIFIQVWHFST